MLKPWEICVLVYDYLNKNEYNKTTLCFNKECPTLQLTDPPPSLFNNVVEKLLLEGDLADRLNKLKTDINDGYIEKIEELQKEVSQIRKRLKRRRHAHSDEKRNSKQARLNPNSANFSNSFQMHDTSYHNISSAQPDLNSSNHIPALCSTLSNTGGVSNINQFLNSQTFTMDSKLSTEMKTPEKPNLSSSSKRKKATPKKLTSSAQGSFIQTLADNINAKNEEAALDTLNSAEPWLEQFISSISEPAMMDAADTNLSSNEEAALSLLSLNPSVDGRIQTPPPLLPPEPAADTSSDLLSSVIVKSILDSNPPSTSTPVNSSQSEGNNEPFSATASQPLSLEPIVIKNKNTLSALKNTKNVEIIVLPSTLSQYTKILPKPAPISEPVAVPCSYYVGAVGEHAPAPVYNYIQTTSQQKAKSFFNQLDRPYHQQLSRLDQLYLVDTSVSKETTPQKSLGNACPARSSSQPDNQTTPNTVSQNSSKPKESFIAWDQKMRQVIAETTFKEPSPVEKKKRKKRSKVKKESSRDEDPTKPSKEKKKKRRKQMKNGSGESSKKSSKKKKRKGDNEEPAKKPPITPEFVSESNDSADENDTSEPSLTPRVRQQSESDSMMCDILLKSLKENSLSSTPNGPCASQLLSTPGKRSNDYIKPAFIEENANSSFDINKDSRPKPVVIPEGSQNSCSCHSTHNHRELANVRCAGGKTFSFNEDQDHADSPRNYNESSSVTVSSLFPQLSDSSQSFSPRPKIQDNVMYRGAALQTDDQDSEPEEEGEEGSDGEEIREQTSKLPPLSSQDKDLLESSEEEQDVSAVETKPPALASHRLSMTLSESDVDSPIKNSPANKSPIKKAKLNISPAKKLEISLVKEDITASDIVKNTNVRATILSDEEVSETIEIGFEEDFNDSQELIIDGCDTPDPNKPKRKNTLLNKRSGRNSVNPGVEDSCDAWYQSFPNKMNFICQVCKKYFPSIAVLNVHTETCSRVSLVCDICGRQCASKSGLTLHKKSCVKDTSTPSSKSKGKRKSSAERSKTRTSTQSSKRISERRASEGSKIRISPRKKSLKKKKKAKGEKMHDEEIDEFLGKLRYD